MGQESLKQHEYKPNDSTGLLEFGKHTTSPKRPSRHKSNNNMQAISRNNRAKERHLHVSDETTHERKLHEFLHTNCRSNPYAQGAEC